jgi:uncharacterized membrane protein
MHSSSPPSVQFLKRSSVAWRVGKAFALAALALMCIDFLLTVYSKYHRLDPAAYTMFWTRRGWLWTHLAGGVLTIILGLVQFLTRWQQTYPHLHRWTGRAYMMGMLTACVGGIGLIATSPAPFEIRSAFVATALAWLMTAGVALGAIRRRQVSVHRRWIIRNYLVTLSPVTFRLFLQIANAMKLTPSSEMIAILIWLSWLLPLLICEGVYRISDRVSLRRQNGFKPNPLRR